MTSGNTWVDRKGEGYWGTDRLERMIKTRNLEAEPFLPILDKIPLPMKYKIVDVGCGIGRRHRYFQGATYVGLDRERVMIDNGRKYFPHLKFHLVEAQKIMEALPRYKGEFDLALTFHVLQYNHVSQQVPIIEGIRFLLKPRGFYYLKENTIYKHNNIGYKDLSATRSINEHSYTEAGWVHKLQELGFTLFDKLGRDGYFVFRRKTDEKNIL